MPAFQLDLPHMSHVTVFVPHDEVPRAKELLGELINHPVVIKAKHNISVAGNGQPSIAARQAAERIELDDETMDARPYVGLADRLRQCAWSIVFANSKGRIEAAKAARGDTWSLDKEINQLNHYISMRLDYQEPLATLTQGNEEECRGK